ncbi:MAG TPA: NRDE family protein [Candidatus Limnocylindrales bacterium]|nr:NRDE family protein [Candidatus Limnocylindrales bacterium]
MCTLAVYRGVSSAFPLIVAANRDEFLGRPATPPAPLATDPAIVAGLDLQAGGTWLGCRTDGSARIVGILNRRPSADHAASGPGELSRGSLCMETLQAASVDELRSLPPQQARRYGGFSLFVADLAQAFVIDNGEGGVRVTELGPGLSVLTNLDVNDPRCPRLCSATQKFSELLPLVEKAQSCGLLVPALARVLADHEGSVQAEGGAGSVFGRICVHAGDYGTRSSSMIFVGGDGSVRYFHAEGHPCKVPFAAVH